MESVDREAVKSPRSCVFCGKSPTTREHVVGAWVAPLFPELKSIVGTGEIIRPGKPALLYKIPIFDQKVKAVCKACNNGWMSRIENGVAPFLGPMLVSAKKTRLRPSHQKLLATWAVKTALMLQQINASHEVIPNSEYEGFYAVKQPPKGYTVWVGWRPITNDIRSGRKPFTQTRSQRISLLSPTSPESAREFERESREGAVFFRSTFAIGSVAFQVFGHTMQGDVRHGIVTSDPRLDILRFIWPRRPTQWWPPRHPIDQIGGFDALHNIFNRPPQSASGDGSEPKS